MDPGTRRQKAAALLQHYLGGALLPPHVPGDPASLVVALRGSLTAHVLLDELGRLYGVDRWDARTFREHVLEDAFPEWKRGTRVVGSADHFVVATPGCPIAADVADDPRICGLCQAAQVAMVERALGGAEARVVGTVSGGLPACLLRVTAADT